MLEAVQKEEQHASSFKWLCSFVASLHCSARDQEGVPSARTCQKGARMRASPCAAAAWRRLFRACWACERIGKAHIGICDYMSLWPMVSVFPHFLRGAGCGTVCCGSILVVRERSGGDFKRMLHDGPGLFHVAHHVFCKDRFSRPSFPPLSTTLMTSWCRSSAFQAVIRKGTALKPSIRTEKKVRISFLHRRCNLRVFVPIPGVGLLHFHSAVLLAWFSCNRRWNHQRIRILHRLPQGIPPSIRGIPTR